MQQLCLTGSEAGTIAGRLFNALNVPPAGLRIAPFAVDGTTAGDAVYLFPPAIAPGACCVPCRIRLTQERTVIVPEVLQEVAVPALRAAMRVQSPILLQGLTADLLMCAPFAQAVCQCLQGDRPVVVTADDVAARMLQAALPEAQLLCFAVPADADGQASLLEALIPEAALRF